MPVPIHDECSLKQMLNVIGLAHNEPDEGGWTGLVKALVLFSLSSESHKNFTC